MSVREFGERSMLPIHYDAFCSRLVTFVRDEFNESRLIERGADDDFLSLLNVGTDPDDEFCVIF